jgi:hypothetical protein
MTKGSCYRYDKIQQRFIWYNHHDKNCQADHNIERGKTKKIEDF